MSSSVFDISKVRHHIYGLLAELPGVQSMPWAPYTPKMEYPACPKALYRALDVCYDEEACHLIHEKGHHSDVGAAYRFSDALAWNAVVEHGDKAHNWEKIAVAELWDRMIVAVIEQRVKDLSSVLSSMSPALWKNMDDFCDQFVRMLQSDINCGMLYQGGGFGLRFDHDGKGTWPVITDWKLEFRQENNPFAPSRLLAEDIAGPLFA
ncbi:hypothetical protein [Sulfitobacter sp. R18_1]|uniref:hypothetical protein n=1 Tax=Sulfitobacter sp. R18_1 TaxID=2821104 RepID=UPI001ADA7782|nr:hypothetical protein [Sulfitobacter sp. R18_1]MBO9428161.1 hypothetical protein [Sulfitobacter sp. R18_1]